MSRSPWWQIAFALSLQATALVLIVLIVLRVLGVLQ
jgi:hypothetical protein